jgi:AcrR family transcriptional regulator
MKAAAAPRRKPRQERSKITVNAILGAAARVWATRDFAESSTNEIAERAGVSIGSLYQYFPDKTAILRSLHERHHAVLMARMTAACREPAASLEAALRAIITTAAEHHRRHAAEVRMFGRHLPRPPGNAPSGAIAFQAALRELLATHGAELRIADHDLALFFLKNLGRSIMHAATEHRLADLENGVIVQELAATALAFLTGRIESASATHPA